MNNPNYEFSPALKKYLLFTIAVTGLVTLISYFHSPVRFWVNLLINNFYFIGMALAGLFFLALQNITNSSWMRSYQRIPEAMMSFLPWGMGLMLLGFLGHHTLYEWTHTELVLKDPILIKKVGYLNVTFFLIRLVIYFALWMTSSLLLKKLIGSWPSNSKELHAAKLAKVSAVSMVVFALSFSFFSYDALMSIEPHWFSTIYSVYTFTGMFVSGIAFITLALLVLRLLGYMKDVVTRDHFHDLGKWLFGMSTFWAYIWFCQYMLIWYSNIPEETMYYIIRDHGNWTWLFWSNFVICFAVPFFGLLPRESKRNYIILAVVSIVILVGHWVDLYTLVAPKIYEHNHILAVIGPYEILSAFLFASIYVMVFLYSLRSKALVVKEDPYFEEGLHLHQ